MQSIYLTIAVGVFSGVAGSLITLVGTFILWKRDKSIEKGRIIKENQAILTTLVEEFNEYMDYISDFCEDFDDDENNAMKLDKLLEMHYILNSDPITVCKPHFHLLPNYLRDTIVAVRDDLRDAKREAKIICRKNGSVKDSEGPRKLFGDLHTRISKTSEAIRAYRDQLS